MWRVLEGGGGGGGGQQGCNLAVVRNWIWLLSSIQGPGEASLFLGASVFFAIKNAITDAR